MGLDIGGDDYITKPFKLAIFLSRSNALLRRNSAFRQPDDALHLWILGHHCTDYCAWTFAICPAVCHWCNCSFGLRTRQAHASHFRHESYQRAVIRQISLNQRNCRQIGTIFVHALPASFFIVVSQATTTRTDRPRP